VIKSQKLQLVVTQLSPKAVRVYAAITQVARLTEVEVQGFLGQVWWERLPELR
jgi:hypothetical protein